ncbi:hypothetical protein ACFLXQ_04540 [Chloroflexota bacterium]
MSLSLKLHRSFIFAILFCVFTLAYILSPYWIISSVAWKRYLLLISSAGLGLLWSYFSSNKLEIQSQKISWWSFLLLFAVLGILNYKPIFSVIPWRGDEDFHIRGAIELWLSMRFQGILAAFLFILFLYEGWRRSRQLLISAIFLVLFIVLILSYGNADYASILRYPYISKWVSMGILSLTTPFFGLFSEVSYRIVPFVSAVLLVWFCQYKFAVPSKIGVLFGIAIGTMPLVFYYSSILYLEMPAVLLMTFVCFNIKELLQRDLRDLSKHPAWYALILIGFIKETTIPFIFSFILIRFIIRFWPFSISRMQFSDLIDEVKVIFCTSFPLILYVFYRDHFGVWRKFSPDLQYLFNFEVYKILLRAFWEQFVLFMLLAIGGGIVLALKKQYLILSFLLLAFVADLVFHIIDESGYLGYSRFHLFLVPVIIVSTFYFLVFLNQKSPRSTVFILGGVIAFNIIFSPINLDGTKKPLWGNYRLDISEHYYPYQEAILWLKENHLSDRVRFAGLYYPYAFEFYFQKFNWAPTFDVQYVEKIQYYVGGEKDDAENLGKSLFKAKTDDVQVVLYHMLGEDIPEIQDKHGFDKEKVFRNDAHTLVLYSVEAK